jgi:polysaccharide biosynthesis transport protein
VVQLDVRATNPKLAARAANLYATQYLRAERATATSALASAVSKLQSTASSDARQVLSLQNQLATQTTAGPEADSLNAELSAAEESSLSVRQQLSQYQTALSLTTGGGVLIDAAVPSSTPVVPKPAEYVVAALFVGAILGAALALLVERLDDRIRSQTDAESLLGAVPVIGKVPKMRIGHDLASQAMVTIAAPHSSGAEAYRLVRTVIQYFTLGKSAVRIQVTSPRSGDGKTVTVANLAVVFAQAGLRVVVVDCDLRLPQIHHIFEVPREPGFTDAVLNDGVTRDDVLNVIEDIPNLSVVTAGSGTPFPTDLLSSGPAQEMLKQLADGADLLLIDTPPITVVADAVVVVPAVDFSLLVVASGRTTRRELTETLSEMERVSARIIGCVINRTDRRDLPRKGYGYGSPTASPVASERDSPEINLRTV